MGVDFVVSAVSALKSRVCEFEAIVRHDGRSRNPIWIPFDVVRPVVGVVFGVFVLHGRFVVIRGLSRVWPFVLRPAVLQNGV